MFYLLFITYFKYYILQFLIMQTYISLARRYISWLKKSEGVFFYDKVLLFCIKLFYLSLRIILLVLGKKRSNKLIEEWDLCFRSSSTDNTTLYEAIKELLNSYNFKIEFENKVSTGERHIVARKQQL